MPLPVAAIARGTVDAAFNAGVILFTGVLILVYMVAEMLGHVAESTSSTRCSTRTGSGGAWTSSPTAWCSIFVAGTWYLLAKLITGSRSSWQNVGPGAPSLVELVVSWTVWSHHLLSDQAQPAILKIVLRRDGDGLRADHPGAGVLHHAGDALEGPAADDDQRAEVPARRPDSASRLGVCRRASCRRTSGLNRILHNTQWVVGPHVHVAVLVGLTMTLYSAVYMLLPILTNGAKLYSQKLANFHFWAHLLGGIGMGAFMGMAGLAGHAAPDHLLRRRVRALHDPGRHLRRAAAGGSRGLPAQHRHDRRVSRARSGIFLPAKGDAADLLPPAPTPAA